MKMFKIKSKVSSTLDINTRVGDHGKILIICEDKDNARRTRLALGNQHDYHIVSTGKEGLQAIKEFSISMALIPIDLKDMDFTDFIQYAKQHSPETLFILITNNILPDLSFLVTNNEIDAFTPEPLSVSSLIMIRHISIENRIKYNQFTIIK
jgi:PleD family two-component response regulator